MAALRPLDHVRCDAVVQQGVVQPGRRLRVDAALRDSQVRHHEDVVLGDGRHQLVRHHLVAGQMGEAVDAGRHRVRRIRGVEDVGDHLEVAGVGLVDHRRGQFRLQLLDRANRDRRSRS